VKLLEGAYSLCPLQDGKVEVCLCVYPMSGGVFVCMLCQDVCFCVYPMSGGVCVSAPGWESPGVSLCVSLSGGVCVCMLF
jgi:hypothetical protein